MTIDVQSIRRSIDLVTLVQKAGGSPVKRGREWVCPCPIHRGENPQGFHIYPAEDGLRWKCFTDQCGSGDSIAFVMAWQGLDFVRACQYLTGDVGIDPQAMAKLAEERAAWALKELEEKTREAEKILEELRTARSWESYAKELEGSAEAREIWLKQGINPSFQKWWQLGYNPLFHYTFDKHRYTSPSLTIPVFGAGWSLQNIRHRILQPVDPQDKYRPEYMGLKATPFVCDPDLTEGTGKLGILCEGEKKSMVVYQTLDTPETQVLGMPGKTNKSIDLKALFSEIDEVYVIYDPDGTEQAENAAREIGERARVVDLPFKVDDMILQAGLEKEDIKKLLKQSRVVPKIV